MGKSDKDGIYNEKAREVSEALFQDRGEDETHSMNDCESLYDKRKVSLMGYQYSSSEIAIDH
jgi:hypothetical protein